MNASSPMYDLKPLTSAVDILPVDCMYGLKSFHKQEPAGQGDDINRVVNALEQRQESLLCQLRKLKIEVDGLVGGNNVDASGGSQQIWQSKTRSYPSFQKGKVLMDLVITANPQTPPLSIIVLHKMLSKQYQVFSSCLVHSSVSQIDDKLKNVFNSNASTDRSLADLALTLIWKDGPHPRATLSVPSAPLLEGETVIARYLARLLSPAYDDNNLGAVAQIDYFVDLAADMLRSSAATHKVVTAVSKKLAVSNWLVGSTDTLADIVMWSAFEQLKPDSLPVHVSKWQQQCQQHWL